jgi:hypothetical protein
VGIPALATARVSSDATPRRSLAAFPGAILPADQVLPTGVIRPPLRGFVGILNIALSPRSSLSSEGITSGPFLSTAVFAIARRRDFAQRLAPSRFEDTQGIFPPGRFLAFRRHRPAIRCWTAILCTCGAPHARSQGGADLRGYRGGRFAFELDLACLRVLLGKIMMSQDVHFVVLGKGSERWFCFIPAPAWNFEILPPQKIIFKF